MAYALLPAASIDRPARERGTLIFAVSVLLHVAVGWAIINLLVVRTLPEPDQSLVIEMAPPIAVPAPAAPNVAPDEPKTLPMPERSDLAPPKPEAPPGPPTPLEPAQGSVGAPGATGPITGPIGPPLAAPRPTYRADVEFPRRAQFAERDGVAVVEVLITAGGIVGDMCLVSEAPGGYGFGEAALKSVANWRFETAQPGVYRVTVRFTME